MNIRHFNAQIAFADAPLAEDFRQLHQLGYQIVVNNRPDEEDGPFLHHQQEKALAEQLGMDYVYMPFTFDTLSWEYVDAFHRRVERGGKILAHCRSGARSVSLFLLHDLREGLIDEAEFRAQCQQFGADADKALTWYANRVSKPPQAEVHHFYEPESGSLQYVIADGQAKRCAIIDPVLDFDRRSGAVSTQQAQRLLDFIQQKNWQVAWILDTHPHADHFSAAAWLAEQTAAPTGIGEKVAEVQRLWQKLYHLPDLNPADKIWDTLFKDGDVFYVGNLRGEVILSPGHTLASVTYHIADCAFIHDTFFMPDSGTARADFPGGSAAVLWDSLQRILQLPDDTRLFTGHDYRPDGRDVQFESTVRQQRENNPWVVNQHQHTFIARRQQRDATLPLPELMLMALQVNINGGRLPEPESDGERYLKIPLNRFSLKT